MMHIMAGFCSIIKMNKVYGKYLLSVRPYIVFAALFFAVAFLWGYSSAKYAPQEAEKVLENLAEIFSPLIKLGPFSQFLAIFFNNALTAAMTLIFGFIFGIFPLLVILSNGIILGILAFSTQDTSSWGTFIMGILPHGIIELPLIILTAGLGIKIGSLVIKKVFKKQGCIKEEIFMIFTFFVKVIIPLLLIAAAIEVFITPLFFSI